MVMVFLLPTQKALLNLIFRMKMVFKQYIIFFLFFITSARASDCHISGFVKDLSTNEVLIGANLKERNHLNSANTDNRGYFNISVNAPCDLEISYVGYQAKTIHIEDSKDTLVLVLLESVNNLNEVVVTASNKMKFDMKRLISADLALVPTLGGKPDIIKTLQLLPGVQSQSEGLNLMFVRGGEPGQNQYLLDNVPLIYVNHLSGLTSVFNPDIINSVDFYKGNFPARLGGKLSSIIDISQREGDVSKHQGNYSLGLIDASFSSEGPLLNNKFSYIVTARKTFTDALIALATTISDGSTAISSYGFHDINGKISWKPDNKNNLSLNIYQGDDYLLFLTKPWEFKGNQRSFMTQAWGNWLVAGHWNRVINSRLYSENILSYSKYRNMSGQKYSSINQIEGKRESIITKNQSSVKDFSFRSAWKYALYKHWNIESGVQASSLVYEPNYNYNSTSQTSQKSLLYNSSEMAFYLDNKINLHKNILISPSIRCVKYLVDDYSFSNLEPRINFTFVISNNNAINVNYMKVSQTSHLIFASGQMLNKEVWLPANTFLKPQTSEQISMGWNSDLKNGMMGIEMSMYYKKMNNLSILKDGYDLFTNIAGIEQKLETGGVGKSYGAELSVLKKQGSWTGSASYAWSEAKRIFANINNGEMYNYEFNRPHSITLNLNKKISNSWNVNVVWLYQTGLAYTPAIGRVVIADQDDDGFAARWMGLDNEADYRKTTLIYGKRNSKRMEAYHRLDVGLNHYTKTKKGNRAVWTFSVYNLYNRHNPYNYYYDEGDEDREAISDFSQPIKLYKVSLFPLIPSVSYKVFFDYKNKKADSKKIL
jgi:hypothetical protein